MFRETFLLSVVLRDIKQHTISLNSGIDRRVAINEMLRKAEHLRIVGDSGSDVSRGDDWNSTLIFHGDVCCDA